MTLTQETILKFPEFFEASNAGFNTNDSENPASNVVKDVTDGEKPTKCVSKVVTDATPLRSVMPDEIINLDNVQTVTTKKRKKHNMLYSDSTYPERRRVVKKSKYLDSPYDDAVHESTATELQKNLSTYAWSSELDQDELLYCSDNRAHDYFVERIDLWSLQQDKWVSCFVINVWINCLNWNQQRDKMTRLVTPMINYVELERPGAFDKNNPAAFTRFIERLSKFKYLDWKAIDPNSLEYIMTPALIGDPGSHYVCFVVNLKSQKFEYLNSLTGDKLHTKNGAPTVYKDMFDVWLNEVEVFVEEMYKTRKIRMPFKFSTFKWDTPRMPNQVDKDSCGVFCMKFLDEWGGDNTQLDSFKGWSKMKKIERAAKIMDLRIGICSTIISNTSNCRRNLVENKAKIYYEKKLQKLQKH
ncbi:putative Ulp1 protease family catalytic domain-containing protein [Medicago truncatula]|uniref:Putative Ulp1 protease family catalytic domain-containing protein n=1 Tax=Medicago truncatula TaxID=3880 RepID=A0A396HJE0_MEDTR|nr:uncharacterized protein LOC112417788 [Medicago truncatula]RHN51385.1 putative Ulp1 protease family catalytic domain-containing protein [Medicago truncatula]